MGATWDWVHQVQICQRHNVGKESSKIKWGQIHIDYHMEVKLERLSNFKGRFKVTRGHPRSNSLSLLYRFKTWCVDSSSDGKYFEGQFKVIRGQMVYHCSMDMKFGGYSHLWMLWGQFKITRGHPRSNGLSTE